MYEFHSKWEALIEKEYIVAEGIWFYDNEIPFTAVLIKQKWNYASTDLPVLKEILEIPYMDYISFSISDEGIIYFWRFNNKQSETTSIAFPTYFLAREHLDTYGCRYEINWKLSDS